MPTKEFTIEITDYCPFECQYCSSEAINRKNDAHFLTIDQVKDVLNNKYFDILHISGGEPLSHPDFFEIKIECDGHARQVIVHTNMISNIAFNPNVLDGIYVETYLNVPETTDCVHVLKRINQGKESKRPKVHLSHNWEKACHGCGHEVLKADGITVTSPCQKFMEVKSDG